MTKGSLRGLFSTIVIGAMFWACEEPEEIGPRGNVDVVRIDTIFVDNPPDTVVNTVVDTLVINQTDTLILYQDPGEPGPMVVGMNQIFNLMDSSSGMFNLSWAAQDKMVPFNMDTVRLASGEFTSGPYNGQQFIKYQLEAFVGGEHVRAGAVCVLQNGLEGTPEGELFFVDGSRDDGSVAALTSDLGVQQLFLNSYIERLARQGGAYEGGNVGIQVIQPGAAPVPEIGRFGNGILDQQVVSGDTLVGAFVGPEALVPIDTLRVGTATRDDRMFIEFNIYASNDGVFLGTARIGQQELGALPARYPLDGSDTGGSFNNVATQPTFIERYNAAYGAQVEVADTIVHQNDNFVTITALEGS